MSRLSVAFVAHGVHDRGGMERVVAELIRGTADRIAFTLLATHVQDDIRELVDWVPIRVPSRPAPLRFSAFWAAAGARLRDVDADLVHTVGAIVPNRTDIASVHFCHAAFAALPAAVRGVDGNVARRLNRTIDGRVSEAAERHCYRAGRTRMLTAVSSGIARELHEHFPGVPTTVIANGVDGERFRADPVARSAIRARLGYAGGDVVAVFLGGDWRRKGLVVAIDAVAEARRRGASHLRLLVVGRGDEEAAAEQATAAGVRDAVTFFGVSARPQDQLQAADIFVSPTGYEAFGLNALEAASVRLPVVATSVHGIEDFVVDGVGGFLCPRTPRAFADAMTRLHDDPVLRRTMGEAARVGASRYTWEAANRRTAELYAALASTPRP